MQNQDNESKITLPSTSVFGIKVIRYRIVTDAYCGYECQAWRIWFPFWLQIGGTNTHISIARAVDFIEKHRSRVVLTS